jgi:hypothetical protein
MKINQNQNFGKEISLLERNFPFLLEENNFGAKRKKLWQ